LYAILVFFSFFPLKIRAEDVKKIDSLSTAANRVLVTVTQNKNIISLEGDLGIQSVKIISANPLEGLDFREYPTLVIRIEVDGREIVNEKLMDYVPGRNKKKKVAYFEDEKFNIEKFISLKIIIEDPSMDLKKFKIDIWLFLH